MSFDNTIAALINAINANTEAQRALAAQMAQPHAHPVPTITPTAPAIAAQQSPAQQQMPAAPTFGLPAQQQPAPVQQAPVAPFTTQQDLFNYTTAAYQGLEAKAAGSGNRIMQVLTTLGISNLNELKPEQYGPFYQHVESLKAGA